MTVRLANGDPVDRNDLPVTAYVEDDPLFVVNADLWVDELFPGSATQGHSRRVASTGDVVRTSDIDRWYAAASPPEPEPPVPPAPPTDISATITFHYAGAGWTSIDADLTASVPGRTVYLATTVANLQWTLTTGEAYTNIGTIPIGDGTPFEAPLRLTDMLTGAFDEETVPFSPALTGPYILTIPIQDYL